MRVWPVLVVDWQFDCCGNPFAVGDEVEWRLLVLREPEVRLPEAVRDLELDVRPFGNRGAVAVLGDGAVAACTPDLLAAEQPVRLRGALAEERHGSWPEGMPPTRGVIRRIRVEARELERVGEVWDHVPLLRELWEARQMPPHFGFRDDWPEDRQRVPGHALVDFEPLAAPQPGAEA